MPLKRQFPSQGKKRKASIDGSLEDMPPPKKIKRPKQLSLGKPQQEKVGEILTVVFKPPSPPPSDKDTPFWLLLSNSVRVRELSFGEAECPRHSLLPSFVSFS